MGLLEFLWLFNLAPKNILDLVLTEPFLYAQGKVV